MEPIGSIHVAQTTSRTAEPEPGRFGEALRNAAATVAGGVASSVALAAPFIPGGTVLAAAVRTAPAAVRSSTSSSPAASAASAASGGEGDLLEATRALQQESRSFNLEYLQLQEAMQRESREFTALSNVMKVKHESAKAAINNIH